MRDANHEPDAIRNNHGEGTNQDSVRKPQQTIKEVEPDHPEREISYFLCLQGLHYLGKHKAGPHYRRGIANNIHKSDCHFSPFTRKNILYLKDQNAAYNSSITQNKRQLISPL